MESKKYISLLFIFLITSIILMSVGYSAFNEELNISGEAYVRLDYLIRITDIRLKGTSNNGLETYSPKYSKNTTKTFVTLPNKQSTVTYEVTITNKTGKDIYVRDIVDVLNNNSNITYSFDNMDKYIKYSGEEIKFEITFSNKTDENQIGIVEIEYEFVNTITASDLSYDNTKTKLECTTVQCALDNISLMLK